MASDLKDKLKGASVTYNHPITETVYSFSEDDVTLFLEYKLEILRGCDEKYTYELTNDPSKLYGMPKEWQNEYDYQHSRIVDIAGEYGIGYRRRKND